MIQRKRGFTLVELLAIIVILVIILAIAIPGISGIINNATRGAFKSDAKMILKQLEYEKLEDESFDVTTVTVATLSNYNLSSENYDDLRVGLVNNEPYIIIFGKNKWAGLKACGTFKNMTLVLSSDTETCEDIPIPLFNPTKGVNRPVLATGMIPVKWDSTDWVTTTEVDNNWYNYTTVDKKWANAKTADGSMWVWIPRYAYQISTGYHTNTAGTINIKFLKEDTNNSVDATTIEIVPTYSGSSQTNYIIHPAFTFGTTELTGIWVAKFEASGTTSAISIKPNLTGLAGPTVGELFDAGRSMETNSLYGWGTTGTNIDTHMMKNIEWGAAAYLSKSSYGKETEEVWINPTVTTGCAGDAASSSASGSCLNAYNTENGVKASTTGTIYGIYDMSGGRTEFTAAYANTSYASYGGGLYSADAKYKDVYIASPDYESNNYINAASKKGDALYETSSGTGVGSWYGDNSHIAYQNLPFFNRGGINSGTTGSGIFSFAAYTYDVGSYGFRPVIIVGEGL